MSIYQQQTFNDFVGVNVSELPALIERGHSRMSGPWRVWEICLSRMNNWGHASFMEGELAKLATGKDSHASRTQVNKWLKTLAEIGRVVAVGKGGTTQLCVVVNCRIVSRNAGKASDYLCSEPGHKGHQKERWPDDDDWQDDAAEVAQEVTIQHVAIDKSESYSRCPACYKDYGNYEFSVSKHEKALAEQR